LLLPAPFHPRKSLFVNPLPPFFPSQRRYPRRRQDVANKGLSMKPSFSSSRASLASSRRLLGRCVVDDLGTAPSLWLATPPLDQIYVPLRPPLPRCFSYLCSFLRLSLLCSLLFSSGSSSRLPAAPYWVLSSSLSLMGLGPLENCTCAGKFAAWAKTKGEEEAYARRKAANKAERVKQTVGWGACRSTPH